MTRPDYDEAFAQARYRACGRTCGCEYAKAGDLCPAGESKAEAARDERGNADSLWTVVGAVGIGLGALTIIEPKLLLALVGYLAVALPVAVVLGRAMTRQTGGVDRG